MRAVLGYLDVCVLIGGERICVCRAVLVPDPCLVRDSLLRAQVVFATVVTRGPRSAMAPQALAQLDQAYELFTQASKHSRRAAKALVCSFPSLEPLLAMIADRPSSRCLRPAAPPTCRYRCCAYTDAVPTQPILLRLREKAHCAFATAQTDPVGTSIYDGALWNIKSENDEDELDIFAGRTAVVASKKPSPTLAHIAAPVPGPSQINGNGCGSGNGSGPGAGLQLITPPTTIPIAPIPGSSNGIPLTDAWPVHSHSHTHSHTQGTGAQIQHAPSPFESQPSHQAQQMHQASYRMGFSHPAPPAPQQSAQGYQWVGQHSPNSLTPPAQGYGAGISPTHAGHGHGQYSPHPSPFPSDADLLQRYANATPNPGAQFQQARGSHPQQSSSSHFAPPNELVNLGLASRHGRLDERWTSFMHENGFL